MIPYTQLQSIPLGPINIQVWGLVVAIGIIIALILALRRAKKVGIKQSAVYDIVFYSMLTGLIGSRIGYILFYWPADIPLTFLNAINITKGGLAFTFGMLTAVIADVAYLKLKKMKVLQFLDFMAPYLVLAHAIGRVGCFLIGDHIGKTTDFFLGVMVNGAVRHNVALYEVIALLLIFAALVYLRRLYMREGSILFSYLALYSLLRFPIDFLRVEQAYLGMTTTQHLLAGLFVISVLTLIIRRKK